MTTLIPLRLAHDAYDVRGAAVAALDGLDLASVRELAPALAPQLESSSRANWRSLPQTRKCRATGGSTE